VILILDLIGMRKQVNSETLQLIKFRSIGRYNKVFTTRSSAIISKKLLNKNKKNKKLSKSLTSLRENLTNAESKVALHLALLK